MTEQKVKFTAHLSELLDPEFCADLAGMAREFDAAQHAADTSRWDIAMEVNFQYDEHKTLFETKAQYFEECSRVLNTGCKNNRKRWADSGETLRRWCEVQATYNNMPNAEKFLDALSFDHLFKARKLYNDGKVNTPATALARAIKDEWTAGEMQAHYNPQQNDFFGLLAGLSDAPQRLGWDAEKAKKYSALIEQVKELLNA